MKYIDDTVVMKRMKSRLSFNKIWKGIFLAATLFALLILVVLIVRVVGQGAGYLNFDFLNNFASRFPEKAGIKAQDQIISVNGENVEGKDLEL